MVKLSRSDDRVYAFHDNITKGPVAIVWARPLSGHGGEVALLSECGEVIMVENLQGLDCMSREIAEQELGKRYFMPEIKRVVKTEVFMGNRYFDVETNRGPRRFIIKNPFVNIRVVNGDRMVLRDVIGNQFVIPSLSNLDFRSQQEIEKVT